MNKWQWGVVSAVVLLSFGPVAGQSSEELFYVRRGSVSLQASQDVLLPAWSAGIPVYSWSTIFGVDFDTGNGSVSMVKISGPPYPDGRPMDMMEGEPLEYELEVGHSAESEFNSFMVPGAYTFSWNATPGGSKTESVELGPYQPIEPRKITNYDALQSLDPGKPVVIEWEAFNPPEGVISFIEVQIKYVQDWSSWDTRFIWSTEDMVTEGWGFDPGTTSIEIPPNVLMGSPNNQYLVEVFFARIDSIVETETNPGGQKGVATSAETWIFIKTKEPDPGHIVLTPGEWLHCDSAGWTFGITHEWGYSQCMGWLFLGYSPGYLYQAKLGWLSPAGGSVSSGIWYYSYTHGYIFTTENYGGWYSDPLGNWGNMMGP